ncbi:MAG: DUF1800 domain-containing protein [Ferruginibacter sp.]
MQVSNRVKNQHLLWRAAFGPTAENAEDLHNLSQTRLWNELQDTSSKTPVKNLVVTNLGEAVMDQLQEPGQKQQLNPGQKKLLRQQSREGIKNLNVSWLSEMISSESQFTEKMALFWHGHFACRVINVFYQQQLVNIVRANGCGKFSELLSAVSKSPSMLQFLNNQQNRKQRPNENFAREVMELFTMGRGNYTETDVKEAARAFTGWGFNGLGEFVFRVNQHDAGTKTFLGKTGNFNGDDIIHILLGQKQTALFITQKIYRHFVNEKTDDKKVLWLAGRFFESGYDIRKLMNDIFTSDWFYEDKNIGAKIKSPVELIVGIRRMLPMELANDGAQLLFQRALGQILFYPPNVAGWPGGKSWIDSSTLMLRLQIPQLISNNEAVTIQPKNDDDIMMGEARNERTILQRNNGSKNFVAVVNWPATIKIFEKVPRENLLTTISETVLQTKNRVSNTVLTKYLNNETREAYIKSAIIYLMSTPEYQLC